MIHPSDEPLFERSASGESLVATPENRKFSLTLLIIFLACVVIRPWDFVPILAAFKPVTLAILGILGSMFLAGVKLQYFKLPLSKSLLTIWVMMLISAPGSYWFGYSLDYSIKWFQFLLLFSFIGTLAVSTDGLFAVTRAMTIVGGLLSLLAIYAKMTMQFSAEGRIEGVGNGFLSDPNELAQALVTLLPFAWWIILRPRNGWDRLIGLGCVGLLLVGSVVTESRGGLLSLITAGAVLMLVSRAPIGKKLAVSAMVGVLGLVMMPSSISKRYSTITTAAQTDESAQTRLAVWKAGRRMFADHFLLGTGVGTFEIVYGSRYMDHAFAGDKWYSAHNSIVEAAVELGIVGVSAWLWFTLMPFWLLWRARGSLMAIDEDESPARESLLAWLESMLAAWAGFMVGAMFLSKGFDIPVLIFVALAVAGSELARRWAESYADEFEQGMPLGDDGSAAVGNTGSTNPASA